MSGKSRGGSSKERSGGQSQAEGSVPAGVAKPRPSFAFYTPSPRACHVCVRDRAIIACCWAPSVEISAGKSQHSHVCPCADAGP